jgi:hypothetical protein
MRDHAALVTLLIDPPTCIRCMAVKSGMTALALDQAVGTIATVLVLHRVTGECRFCGTTGTVLYLDRTE